MSWLRRVRATFGSARNDDFVEEMRFHIEQRTDEFVREGVAPDEARRRAQRQFGNDASLRERTRDADSFRWLTDLITDLRYGWRTLARNPGLAIVATATLALGIGANTAIFAAAYGVLLRPLPYPDPARLVRLSEFHEGAVSPLSDAFLSDLTFDAWQRDTRTLDGLAAYGDRAYSVTGLGDAERVRGVAVSPALFAVLGLPPAAGRYFTSNEAVEGADRVVVLSHAYWQRQFGGRADVVGRTLTIDGRDSVIVGVTPAVFAFPDPDRHLFTPFLMPSRTRPDGRDRVSVFLAVGRLAPAATTEQAAAEGTAIARALGTRPVAADLLFGKGGAVRVSVREIVEQQTAAVRPILLLLVAGVSLVLLLGCANVASLLLSLGVTRERELSVRAALGAGRGRLVRQLLAESLALSMGAAIAGLGIAWAIVQAWPALVPASFPRLATVRLDLVPLGVAVVAALVATLLAGVAPALHGSRVTTGVGPSESRGATLGHRSRRTRQSLLVIQSAVAVLLVVGAALLVRSFDRLVHRDSGFEAAGVLTARMTMPAAAPARWQETAGAVVARLQAIPGVAAAGASNMAPLGDTTAIAGFRLPGRDAEPVIARGVGYVVTPGYFTAMRLRLRDGRFLDEGDTTGGVAPMIVNEAFAAAYLDDGRPIVGRRYSDILKPGDTVEVVGVVGNVLRNGLTDAPQPEFYVPSGRHGNLSLGREIYLTIRTDVPAAALAPTLRSVVRTIDPGAPLHTVRDLESELAGTAGQQRFAAAAVGAFAAIALGLAAIGLYGGLMYAVSRRTREMGIRTALGATPGSLVRLVVREGAAVTSAGIAIGLGAAVLVTGVMQGLLYGIDPLDLPSFAAAPALLALVAAIACVLPAYRAISADPVEAIREE
jgi:predicted permease